MQKTLEEQLKPFQGHSRILKIVDLMEVFSNKNAELVYNAIEKNAPANSDLSQYIQVITDPLSFSRDRGVKLTVDDLKIREDEITNSILQYSNRLENISDSRQLGLVKPKDFVDVINLENKFYSRKRIN